VYLARSTFERLNRQRRENGESEFANPRNATAGAIRLLDPRLAAARRLGVWCYQLARADEWQLSSHVEDLRRLQGLGFPVSPGFARCAGLDEVEGFIDRWQERRSELDFDTDGIVVKLDRRSEREAVGATARAVRWAVAYKFPVGGTTTEVVDIVVQVGRTGVLTPVAVLKPVVVAGSTVSRATLHNFDEVARLDVRIGDTVWITKGGEVIPKVVGVVGSERPANAEPFAAPVRCPACAEPVQRVPEEVALRCPNPACPAVMASRLRHFVSRGAMAVDGLGGKLLDQLTREGLLSDPASLWELDPDRLTELPGWGETKVSRLLREIDQARRRPLHRVLFALGIPHVGERTARLLADRFGSLEALGRASGADLEAIEGIGPVMAVSVQDWFGDPRNRALLGRLRRLGIDPRHEPVPEGPAAALEGLTFVLTGTLSRPREAFKERLEELGARVASSVSAATSYVVAGADAGAKLDRARRLGVEEIDEDGLERLIRRLSGRDLWQQ
jgi:DNA ligase (NAD+)